MPRTTATPARKRIGKLDRMQNSRNGNPRWRVTFTDGTVAATEPDAMIAYALNNPEYRDVDVDVTFNGRGWITSVEVAR